MKRIAKTFITRAMIPMAKLMGVNAADYLKNTLLGTFYDVLREIGFVPKHIVDVGANHGTWTKEALRYFPDAYYTLLEPQQWMKESVESLLKANHKVSFHACGVGKEAGSFYFTIVDRDDSCSFRYTTQEAEQLGFKQVQVPVVTLNDFLPTLGLPVPEIIKVDAEGLDLEVLKGANSFFGKTEVFMVEAGVVCKKFDNSFLKVVNYMDANGYRLFEITDLNRPFRSKVLWLVELVFVKKDGFIDSQSFA